jgi:hypothetical protein
VETATTARRTGRALALSGLLLVAACGAGAGTGNTGGVDTSAPTQKVGAYVRSDVYRRLVLEVDSVPGFVPRTSSCDRIEERLAEVVDKPDGVIVTLDGSIASRGVDHAWTFEELDALANQTFDLFVTADTVKMHVLFVDGRYDARGGTVLGLAWGQQHIAIFRRTLDEHCGGGAPLFGDTLCEDAELAIWVHEVGHLLGLVDNGLPMVANHEDGEHPGHDVSQDCVMYWAYEGDALFTKLSDQLVGTGDAALDFCPHCLADLAAVRGR